MNKLTVFLISLLCGMILFLSGCSTLPSDQHEQIIEHQNIVERTKKLNALSHWKIKGKLAFISPKERHSATLNWHFQGDERRQSLNLTTVLGIQVFNLVTVNGMNVVEVDGERYQSPDLDELLASLTGFTLPTQAMSFWLKGLPYLTNDTLIYHQQTQLPQLLTSYHNNKQWQVKYGGYQQVAQYQLATKFTIKQDDLTIKINVHQWDVERDD